jgi:hypothetical protein
MGRSLICAITTLAFFLVPGIVEAGIMCNWFGRCLYESPGFSFKVVDKETGQPLADVHALAEWVQHGYHGRNGPLMVQDAVSGPDGVLRFPAWGPLRGTQAGLVINSDPVLTLFKLGYKVLLLNNAAPIGLEETDRVRGFSIGIQTSALEPFRGTTKELIQELDRGGTGATFGRTFEDQIKQFRSPYLNRTKRVWAWLQAAPKGTKGEENYIRAFERDLKYLEELGQ